MPRSNQKILFAAVALLLSLTIRAQDTLYLSRDEFMSVVKKYHPLLLQYQTQTNIARKQISAARGSFDPVIGAKTGEKEIESIPYYSQQKVELTIPTWYGIDFNAGYNNLSGIKLNNEETKGELYQIGINIPLAKNLLYDKRRAWVDQTKAILQMTLAEQVFYTNEFLAEAENVYWQWLQSHRVWQMQNAMVQRNQERLAWTKRALAFGERPAIDTTEILAQLQMMQLQQQEAELQLFNLSQEIQAYLWKENRQPYIVLQPLLPRDEYEQQPYLSYQDLYLQMATEQARSSFQGLAYYRLKRDFLQAERRLKRQELLPKIDFSYQLFNRNLDATDYLPLFTNNYQYGLKFEVPLFLRRARAELAIANMKLFQNDLDLSMKDREVMVKINSLKNELDIYVAQIKLTEDNLKNYTRLLQAEELRFDNGESSVFLINTRELKVIETQVKLVELKTKFAKAYNKLKWMRESMLW